MGDRGGCWLVVVTGWTGAGKSTIADELAQELYATAARVDWVMSGLRPLADVWPAVETPVELQRREWEALARHYDARFGVIECICSDRATHRSRVEQRDRSIPGWYELGSEQVATGRDRYEPLTEPKLVLDATSSLSMNVAAAKGWLTSAKFGE